MSTNEKKPNTLRIRSMRDVGMLLMKARTFIALIILLIVFISIEPKFLSASTFTNISKHVARYAILAIGMTYVIISGGIDLSVGSVAGLSGMVAGGLLVNGLVIQSAGIALYFDIWMVLLLSLAVGALVGLLNGLLISRLNVPAFIATLGTMYIARGTSLLLNQGATFPNLTGSVEYGTQAFPWLGSGNILGLPVIIWFMVVLALAATYVQLKTPLGWHIYATGGNENASKLSGIKVNNIKLFVFVFSSVCAACAGVFAAAELEAAHPATGESWEMNAIAASVLGGTSMAGGVGTIGGTIVGAFVIGVLSDGMIMVGLSSFWQQIIKGIVIIIAVIIDQMQRELQRKLALQRHGA